LAFHRAKSRAWISCETHDERPPEGGFLLQPSDAEVYGGAKVWPHHQHLLYLRLRKQGSIQLRRRPGFIDTEMARATAARIRVDFDKLVEAWTKEITVRSGSPALFDSFTTQRKRPAQALHRR